MPSCTDPIAASLTADQPHSGVADEGVESADRVRAAAHAGYDRIGQPASLGLDLLPGLDADDPLEITNHHRERVRAHHRADAVMGGLDARHPVAEGLVDRVLERLAADRDRDDLGAEHLHPGDVQRLPPGVFLAHVDDALKAEQRRRRRRGYAMLAGSGLGDDPGLAHAPSEQRLPEHVVDLVRAGMGEVLALEEDPAAACFGGEPGHLGQQRGAACVVAEQRVQVGGEGGSALAYS